MWKGNTGEQFGSLSIPQNKNKINYNRYYFSAYK